MHNLSALLGQISKTKQGTLEDEETGWERRQRKGQKRDIVRWGCVEDNRLQKREREVEWQRRNDERKGGSGRHRKQKIE